MAIAWTDVVSNTFWYDDLTKSGVMNPTSLGQNWYQKLVDAGLAPALAPGQPVPTPIDYLNGVRLIDPKLLAASAQMLFPLLDGVNGKLASPPPEIVNHTPPDQVPADGETGFLGWHSAYQLQYLQENGTGTPKSATIGINGNTVTVMMSSDGRKMYNLDNLSKQDFSKMPLADQRAMAKLDRFLDVISTKLGLVPTRRQPIDESLPNSTHPVKKLAQDLIDGINLAFPKGNLSDADYLAKFGPMAAVDKETGLYNFQIFVKEMENVLTRLNNQAIYSTKDIQERLSTIQTRYNRAKDFGDAPTLRESPTYQYRGAISLDGGQTVRNGFAKFIEQEKRIFQLDLDRLAVSDPNTPRAKNLDVPNLVYLLQLSYNLTIEARVTAETEEINQQNALLQTYQVMQQIVNQMAPKFDSTKTGDKAQKLNLLGNEDDKATIGSLFSRQYSHDQKIILSMFEDALATSGLHPIEKMRGVLKRPSMDYYHNDKSTLNRFFATDWTGFGTQLSDTVSLINQGSQIKMNDINSLNKQKDRHYDLATGALSKAFDMIQSIGRSIA